MEKIDISMSPLKRMGRIVERRFFQNLDPPLVMGIINITPDSFSDGGRFLDRDRAVSRGLELVEQGADLLDIGGESTRPFSDPVPPEEEMRRVIPVIEELSSRVDVPLSIDTRRQEIAMKALDAGASIINDVNGFRGEGMEELASNRDASVVIMHMLGTPGDMQLAPSYEDVVSEVHDFLAERIDSLIDAGCRRRNIIVDPGIGFGKRVSDNLKLIRDLDSFHDLRCPILVGASRKTFIGKVLGTETDQRYEGSLSAAVMSYMKGASILRVHDVLGTRRAIEIARAVLEAPIIWD